MAPMMMDERATQARRERAHRNQGASETRLKVEAGILVFGMAVTGMLSWGLGDRYGLDVGNAAAAVWMVVFAAAYYAGCIR